MPLFVFVIFINKKMSKDYSAWTNVGYLTAMLKKNMFETKVCFYELGDNQYSNAAKEISELNPDFVGLSILQDGYYYSLKFAKELKKINPCVKIIAGNIMSTLYYKYILENEESIDYISLGEGEYSLPNLCQMVLQGKTLEKCEGIVYRDERNNIFKNDCKVILDLDLLPFPDRSFMNRKSHNFYPVIGSRGCLGHCSFCESNVISKGIYRRRSIDNIIDEILMLIKEYNCKYVSFMDPTFYDDSEKLEQMYSKFKEKELWIQFFANFRAENIIENNIQKMLKIQEIGLEKIFIGVESGNSDDLKLYGKIASLQDNERAIGLLHKYGFIDGSLGIEFDYGFINFNPYTTIDKIYENIAFVKRNKLEITPESFQRRLAISGGCPITKKVIYDGLLTQDSNIPIVNPFCYRFKDEKIKIIYSIAHFFKSCFHMPAVGDLLCLYSRIMHFDVCEKEDDKFLDYYNAYKSRVTEFTIKNYFTILNIGKFNSIEAMHNYINNECIRFQTKIDLLYKSLLIYKYSFTKRLLKINELVY